MIRTRIALIGVVLAVASAGASALGAGASAAATSASPCQGVIRITRLAFKPPTVVEGQSSTAHVAARNCTDHAQQTTVTWVGRFAGPGDASHPGARS